MKKILLMWVVFNIFIFDTPLEARWGTRDDVDYVVKELKKNYTIQKDGSYTCKIETDLEILKDGGRSRGTHALYYSPESEKITLDEASTITQGIVYPVDQDAVDIKPVASDGTGFDETMQITLSHPKVEPGSILRLKYTLEKFKPVLKGSFDQTLFFGDHGTFHDKAVVTIKSFLPLALEYQDPLNALSIEKKEDEVTTLKITLKKPVGTFLEDEPGYTVPADKKTWISVSSWKNTTDLARAFVDRYEKRVQETLPKILEAILEQAKTKKSFEDKVNHVMSSLQDCVRYMGDWRTTEGALFPRSFEDVVKTGYGDCKDYATMTTALLRHLGYKTHVSFVCRGYPYFGHSTLPSIGSYNHAIVHVEGPDGRAYWIDPTNRTSTVKTLYADIAGRPALLLDPQRLGEHPIPSLKPEEYREHTTAHFIYDPEKNRVIQKGVASFFHQAAAPLSGATLSRSESQISRMIVHRIKLGSKETVDEKVDLPDLSSRIIKNHHVPYHLTFKNPFYLTNMGFGHILDTPFELKPFLDNLEKNKGDCLLLPQEIKEETFLENAVSCSMNNLQIDISSKWVDYKRDVIQQKEGIHITSYVKIKQPLMTAQDRNQKSFLDTIEIINSKTDPHVLIFRFKEPEGKKTMRDGLVS